MFEHSRMMQTNYLLERGLDVESTRRNVIANNIANVDVPHFKRSEVNFESELQRVIKEKADPSNRFQARMTDERHIPFYVERDVRGVRPRINLDYSTTLSNFDNNVAIERETVDAAKTQMRYNAYVNMLNQNYKVLKLAMRPA
ncbi:MAG: flagellar basal body rod protein FlgB [Spirochaetales bacterium]|nr:MAG: flagellar basal body rod protein FlgB [Spirochaetales bacterium]